MPEESALCVPITQAPTNYAKRVVRELRQRRVGYQGDTFHVSFEPATLQPTHEGPFTLLLVQLVAR